MAPYLVMLSVPSLAALLGVRRSTILLMLIAAIYWVMIGFRYQVGMDWNNYVILFEYNALRNTSITEMFSREPGFALLNWFAAKVGGGVILVNAVSALTFCWGFFAVAARCREPFLAIIVGTPLLVIAFAMSGVRQAMAMGIICFLFATWHRRGVLGRIAFVLLATLFHFSALFVLMFVALSARIAPIAKTVSSLLIGLLIFSIIYIAPEAFESYSELYVAGEKKLEAPGAIAQVGIISLAAAAYFAVRGTWVRVHGDEPLFRNLAYAALVAVPAVFVSSVGSYRFALYMWPMAMYVWSGMPSMFSKSEYGVAYRASVIVLSVALLVGWLTTSNSGLAWLPYQNWLMQPDDAALIRRSY